MKVCIAALILVSCCLIAASLVTRHTADVELYYDPTRYFSEISLPRFKLKLDGLMRATLPQEWESLLLYRPSLVDNPQKSTRDVIAKVESGLIPFEVKGVALAETRVPSYDYTPVVYSKWNLFVHRDNKMYGFAFNLFVAHIEDRIYLCHHSDHGLVTEDIVETTRRLSHQASASSSSSAFSPLYESNSLSALSIT
jgi:hypothetical protein